MCKPSLESNSLSSRCRENISLIQFIWVVQSNTQFVENRGTAWQMIPRFAPCQPIRKKGVRRPRSTRPPAEVVPRRTRTWLCPWCSQQPGVCTAVPGAHAALPPAGAPGRPSPGSCTQGPQGDAPASAPKASQLKRTNPCWHVSLKPAGTRGWRLLSGFPKPGAQLITCQLYLQTSQV